MRVLNEVFFWGHLFFIPLAISIGLFLPLGVVVGLVVVHRLHTFIFGGCFFSRLQRYLGGLPEERDFLQAVSERVFSRKINKRQSKIIDYSLALSPILLAVVA